MNLTKKLKESLNPLFMAAIDIISEHAEKFGINAFIIGGVVRDLILDVPIYDVDIVVEGKAIEFCQYLEQQNVCKIYKTAPDFGTAKVIFEQLGDLQLDVASTRTEKYPRAGHLPVVDTIGCRLKEDIFRRDFTVSALAVSVNKSSFGELTDFTNGLEDIEKKELRILHENSFIDDPTRIIRGLRFAHKLGFSLEAKTKKLQDEYLENFDNNDICYERIKQVLHLAFNLNSAELYNDFINQKIYKLVTQTVPAAGGNNIHEAIVSSANYVKADTIWLIYLACSISIQDSEKLNLTGKEQEVIASLCMLLDSFVDFKDRFDIYTFFKSSPVESIVAYGAIKPDNLFAVRLFLDNLRETKLFVDGNTLKKLGVQEGKQIGEILKKLMKAKINGLLQSEADEILMAKRVLQVD